MAELHIPEGYANCSWKFTLAGDPEPMTFAIGLQLDDAVANPDAFAQDLSEAFYASGGYQTTQYYSQWVHVGTHVTIGNDGPPIVGTFTTSQAGAGGSNATLPQNCSLIVKKTTGFGRRQFRGRYYMPPISLAEADVNNAGMIDSAVVASIQVRVDAFHTQVLAVSPVTDLVLLHTSGAITPTHITAFQVENQIATQRRRLR